MGEGALTLAIALRGVGASLSGRRVLGAVTLAVEEGETLAIVGPSGGGKSTLLRAMIGLVPLDQGEAELVGHRLRCAPEVTPAATLLLLRRDVGMIFQDLSLFPHMSACENVMAGLRFVQGMPKHEARERAIALLASVGLAGRVDAYPVSLSGGEKQRVAIARALAMRPKVLLCDEITSALDPELKGEVLDVLSALRRSGITLVVVTHEMGFARRAADRLAVLDEGSLIEVGAPSAVLDSPRELRTQQFLSRLMT